MTRGVVKEGRRISHSQIGTWLHCEQQWDYSYRQGLTPREKPAHKLWMGDYIHGKLDVIYQLVGQGMSFADAYLIVEADLNTEALTIATNPEFGDIIIRTIKTLRRYCYHYAPVNDEGMSNILSEYHFEYPLTTPNGNVVTLEGYVDLLYKKNGKWIVRDHKSHEKKPWTKEQVYYDMQQTLYIAALRELGFNVLRGEVNLLNTYNYAQWESIPLDKLFKTISAHRTDEQIAASLRWAGKMVDRQDNLVEPQMSRSRSCIYCPFRDPCMMKFEGKDDGKVIRLGFKPKDGYTEWHAAEAAQANHP